MAVASRFRKYLVALVIAVTMAAVMVIAPPANAGTVPNFFVCSPYTKKCVQINGRYVSSVPNSCHWDWTKWYGSGMSVSGCRYWW